VPETGFSIIVPVGDGIIKFPAKLLFSVRTFLRDNALQQGYFLEKLTRFMYNSLIALFAFLDKEGIRGNINTDLG
jgi:hypothetical protein